MDSQGIKGHEAASVLSEPGLVDISASVNFMAMRYMLNEFDGTHYGSLRCTVLVLCCKSHRITYITCVFACSQVK